MKTIQINGVIGYDILSKDIISQLHDAGNEDITCEIHSPGGSVFEGLAIFNALKEYPGKVTCKIMGLAASMATIIAFAKDKPMCAKASVFMIHNPQGIAMGDYRDAKKFTNYIESMTKMMAGIYKDATGKNMTDIRQMMDDETFMYGKGIVENGFAGSIFDDGNADNESDSMLMAKLELEECANKMKNYVEKPEPALVALLENFTNTKAKIPAEAGNNTEELTMTLKEFLAQNPAAQKEYDAEITASETAGMEKGKAEMKAAYNKVSAFIGADSVYPANIQALAKEVLAGTVAQNVLDYSVAQFDKLTEAEKSKLAAEETALIGNTPAEQTKVTTNDGSCRTNDDLEAEIDRTKKLLGMEA
jgi:ATP-dependent Clp endopeptidase proteolytic subunit ClpP